MGAFQHSSAVAIKPENICDRYYIDLPQNKKIGILINLGEQFSCGAIKYSLSLNIIEIPTGPDRE